MRVYVCTYIYRETRVRCRAQHAEREREREKDLVSCTLLQRDAAAAAEDASGIPFIYQPHLINSARSRIISLSVSFSLSSHLWCVHAYTDTGVYALYTSLLYTVYMYILVAKFSGGADKCNRRRRERKRACVGIYRRFRSYIHMCVRVCV